jgi:hypothetical protein
MKVVHRALRTMGLVETDSAAWACMSCARGVQDDAHQRGSDAPEPARALRTLDPHQHEPADADHECADAYRRCAHRSQDESDNRVALDALDDGPADNHHADCKDQDCPSRPAFDELKVAYGSIPVRLVEIDATLRAAGSATHVHRRVPPGELCLAPRAALQGAKNHQRNRNIESENPQLQAKGRFPEIAWDNYDPVHQHQSGTTPRSDAPYSLLTLEMLPDSHKGQSYAGGSCGAIL